MNRRVDLARAGAFPGAGTHPANQRQRRSPTRPIAAPLLTSLLHYICAPIQSFVDQTRALQQHVRSYGLFGRFPCLTMKKKAELKPTKGRMDARAAAEGVQSDLNDPGCHSEAAERMDTAITACARAQTCTQIRVLGEAPHLYSAVLLSASLLPQQRGDQRWCESLHVRVCACARARVFSNWWNPVSLRRALVFTGEPRPTAQTLPYKSEKHKSGRRTRPSIYENVYRKHTSCCGITPLLMCNFQGAHQGCHQIPPSLLFADKTKSRNA